jgi:hypothetical protein
LNRATLVYIDSRYDIAAAHEGLDAGNTTGKIVIDIASQIHSAINQISERG